MSTHTDTLFPYTPLFRSVATTPGAHAWCTPLRQGELHPTFVQRVGAKTARPPARAPLSFIIADRSEEHTSELQSLMRISYAVFCLNKKTPKTQYPPSHILTLMNTTSEAL